MSKRANLFICLLIAGMLITSCSKKSTVVNVNNNCTYSNATNAQVNFTILSGSAQFFPLNVTGGYTYVAGYGLKGILVYRVNSTQFVAFERSCTQDGCNNTKALVWVQTGNTAVKDTTCGSMFNIFDGSIQQGPASIALYQYHTTWDGNQLHVYN